MQKDSCPDISGIYLSKPIDKKVEKASPLDSLANLFFLYTPGRLNTPPWIWAEAFKVNVKLSGRDMMSLVATDQAGLREFTREVPSSSRECRDGVMFFSWADQSAGEDGTHDRFRYLGVYRTDAGQLVVTHNQRDRQRPFPLVSMTAEKHDWYLFAQSRE